jgi:hypothetical protein
VNIRLLPDRKYRPVPAKNRNSFFDTLARGFEMLRSKTGLRNIIGTCLGR